MARPPKYTSDEAKPVGLSLRLPRELYDQAQHHAKMRQTTLTQLVIEGLQMRLETPTDPRDILASHDNTVMQELRQMIADEVQAALAGQHFQAPESTPARKGQDNSKTQHYSNATKKQTYELEQGHSVITEQGQSPEACPPFDPAKDVLGKLCKEGHEWGTTGKTLRRLPNQSCRLCENAARRDKRAAKREQT